MYEFSAIVTNDYTIEIVSNTYWSCKAEGNFKLSSYDGSGNTTIDVEIPNDVIVASGSVYFSYGDERCKFPALDIYFANLCHIQTIPKYTTCNENGEDKKVIYLFYKEPLETFYVSVTCFDNWEANSTDFNYITNSNEVMIIGNGNDGEIRIVPKNCSNKNTIYVRLIKE